MWGGSTIDKNLHIQLNITVIPGQIYRSLLSNRLLLPDLSNYSKIKDYIAFQDLLNWKLWSDSFKIDDVRVATYDRFTDQFDNMDVNIVDMLNSAKSSNYITAFDYGGYEQPYTFQPFNNRLYVITGSGMRDFLKSQENQLQFTKDCLKECYRLESEERVSHLDLFSLYVRSTIATLI